MFSPFLRTSFLLSRLLLLAGIAFSLSGCVQQGMGTDYAWTDTKDLKQYADEMGLLLEQNRMLVKDSGWVDGLNGDIENKIKFKVYVKKFLGSEVVNLESSKVRYFLLAEVEVYCKGKEEVLHLGNYEEESAIVLGLAKRMASNGS